MCKMYVLDAAGMKRADEGTIEELGIGQDVLMERAALAVVDTVMKYQPTKVLCVCGSGNNGGDALAVARILTMRGLNADVYMCTKPEKWKASVIKQYEIFRKTGGKMVTASDFAEYDMIVDGIFGIGLDRNIEGRYVDIIEMVNEAKTKGSKVIAVDISSGIHTDTGAVMGIAVKADETVAFANYKPGHLLYPGADYCGVVTVKEIGICDRLFFNEEQMNCFTVLRDEAISMPMRKRDGNKGTFGRVLIIAGSREMYGACYLSALAAFRMGVGLVDIYTHEINQSTIQSMLPEAILHTYSETIDFDVLNKVMNRADCVVIGPGLSMNQTAMELVTNVLERCNKTIIADADALNCIAQKKDLLYNQKRFGGRELIITPHPGELSRLTGKTVAELKKDYIGIVKKFAKDNGIIVVGKDAGTVVSDGRIVYMNQTGNDGMATAGSGDVLSGIIGALCAQRESGLDAAWKGVFLHGKAGDIAAKETNTYSVMASDIANAITKII